MTSFPRFDLKSLTLAALAAAAVPIVFLAGCDGTGYPTGAHAIAHMLPSPIAAVNGRQAEAGDAAATGCPAINFQTSQMLIDPNPNPEVFGVVRQPDGSFTEMGYLVNLNSQTFSKSFATANIQQSLIACAGLPTRTRHVVAPNSKNDSLGTASRNPLGVDLAGDGAGSLVGYSGFLNINQLMVQRANSDDTARSAPAFYAVGAEPNGVLAADFNGDGKKDIAVVYVGASPTSSGPGGVSILLGNGDGTLKTAVNYPTGVNAFNMTALDFNGDGKIDLAVGHYSGLVQILMGNGDGTMKSGASYNMPASDFAVESIAAADLNGDHIPDLAVLTDATVQLLYGKGDGTFTNGPAFPLAVGGGMVATGDFNMDGITDFAVSSPTAAGVFIYLGTGAGSFAAPVEYSSAFFAYGSSPSTFWVEDFDGDGFLDLVFGAGHPDAVTITDYTSVVGVVYGNGDGTFASGTMVKVDSDSPSAATPPPIGIAVSDFNGDGKLDFASSSAGGKTLSISLGTGAGKFKAPAAISMGAVQPTSIAAGAFGSDGKPDLVVTDGVSNVYLLNHNGDGTFQQPIKYPTGGTNPSFVVTGDFNGDKKLDVVVVNSGSANLSILTGLGNGSLNPAVNIATGPNPVGVVAGDFNGDGKLDLAVANGGTFSTSGTNLGSVSVLFGKGDGTFQAAVNYSAYQYPTYLTAADVNGDGKLDLLVAAIGANGTARVAVLLGSASGTFGNATLVPTSASPNGITVADFSGDGKLDLVVTHCCEAATISTLQGVGDGTFQPEVAIGQGAFFSSAAADFDADGKTDLAFSNYLPPYGRTVTVFRNISLSRGTLTLTNAAGNPLKAPPIAAYSIATAKGTDLATGTVVNSATAPPTTLSGTTVTVTDAAGNSLPAQLFYVSPTQVNFLIPQTTAAGTATVTITSGDGFVSVGTVAVTSVAPAIFTLNSNSLAAAYVQRVHGDGSQSIEYLYAVDGAGNVTFPPIDLGPSTDQVYMNIYGTGIQNRTALSAVTMTVGGVSVTPLYAGPSTYPGEDQIAILLPRSLVGAGTVNVMLTVNGSAANTTTLAIK